MVYDMRGPQVRLLTNLENLKNEVPMPELQYNVRLVVDSAEFEMERIDRGLSSEEATLERLKEEKERLVVVTERQRKQLYSMGEILSVLDQLEEEEDSTLDSLAIAEQFIELRSRFPENFKLYNLSCIACSYALPLFIREFQGWDPLQNPFHGLEVVSLWKDLLESDQEFTASPYSQLISQVVSPAVRVSVINTWQARDPEPMLRFLDFWENLLPPSFLSYDNIVMPKLSSAVGCWEPLCETVPIHIWVHPWLQYLGHKLEGIFETIRVKLSQVLVAWHPSDASAYTLLAPWKTLFDSANCERLMVRSVVPKLQLILQEFEINPTNQKLDEFYWVMKWASDIPIHLMVDMMEMFFFAKWLQVLYHWLQASPNFEEITRWYLGWKELLPKELLVNQNIRHQLSCGLEMMNQAVEGLEVVQPGLEENIGYLRVPEQRHFEAQQKPVTQQAAMSFSMDYMSVKEVIEAHAQEHGLLFKPKPGQRHDGHQIYAFGNLSVIIDAIIKRYMLKLRKGGPLYPFKT
nr:septin and tuftelin-interacting protein 1 like 1 [Quercus suber]